MSTSYLYNIPVLLSGVFYIIMALGLILFMRRKNPGEKQAIRIIKLIIATFLFFYLIYSLTRYLERDEIEHIQSSWLIFKGEIPYFDFFQHHHPLLWFITAPSFYLTGNGLAAVLFFRIINFLFFVSILYVIFRITFEITFSKKASWFSVCVILAINIFSRNAMAIRPDVPMTLFLLLAFFFFIKFWNTQKKQFLIYSGFMLAISFFFLQKAVFFILPFFLLIFYFGVTKKISFKSVLILGLSALFPVLVMLFVYIRSGYFNEYIVFNWLYNFTKPAKSNFFQLFSLKTIIVSLNFIFITLFSVFVAAQNFKKNPAMLNAVFLIGAIEFIIISLLSTVYIHYYIAAIPFLLLPSGYFLSRFFEKQRVKLKFQVLFLFLLFALSLPVMVKKINDGTIFNQIKLNNAFVRKADGGGTILSTAPQLLFIKNAHFFFFISEFENSKKLTLEKVVDNPNYQKWITMKMVKDAKFNPKTVINRKSPVCVLITKELIQKYNIQEILEDKYVSTKIPDLFVKK